MFSLFTILGMVMGCMTSEREEALRFEISALDTKLTQIQTEMQAKDQNISTAKNTAEETNRRILGAKSEFEDIKRQLAMSQGEIDELRTLLKRSQEDSSRRPLEGSLQDRGREIQLHLAELEKQITRVELGLLHTQRSLNQLNKQTPSKELAKIKTQDELTKTLAPMFANKDYKKVIASLNTYIQPDLKPPLKEAALAARGEAFFNERNYESAAHDLAELVSLFPRSAKKPRALLLLGDSFVFLKRPETARLYYAECVQNYPDKDECLAAKKRLEQLGE